MIEHGFEIIDFHSHFPVPTDFSGRQSPGPENEKSEHLTKARSEESKKILSDYAQKLRAEWRLAHGFHAPETEEMSDEELAEKWSKEVDRYGIDKVVFVTGGGNERLANIVSRYPDKFIGFAHHNPHEKGADNLLRKSVTEMGLRGYKIIAPALDTPIDHPSAYPTWEAAADLEIPVLIHFGVLGGGGGVSQHVNMAPLSLHDVARDFASVQFVIPHLGCGYVRELLHLMWSCPNVHVDTSGSNQWIRWMPEEITVKSLLRKYLETVGHERIIFGSDSSWFPRGFSVRYFEDQVRDLRELNASNDQMEAIFNGNARKLLKL